MVCTCFITAFWETMPTYKTNYLGNPTHGTAHDAHVLCKARDVDGHRRRAKTRAHTVGKGRPKTELQRSSARPPREVRGQGYT